METKRALETTGTVDEHGRLHLREPLAVSVPQTVRVLLLFSDPDTEEAIPESDWWRAAGRNPAFDFLHDPAEDLYTQDDGTPFKDEA